MPVHRGEAAEQNKSAHKETAVSSLFAALIAIPMAVAGLYLGREIEKKMPTSAPLVTSAGRNHLILSKQLCILIAIALACAGFLFYRVEQGAVQRSLLSTKHVSETNEALKKANQQLEDAKKKLEADEDDLTKMYEKWIADDSEDLKLTKEEISNLQAKIAAVKAAQNRHEDALADKEDALAGKEDVLAALRMQLIDKNKLIKAMKKQIKDLEGELPKQIEEVPDDDDWAW